jgi:hypothetical protein
MGYVVDFTTSIKYDFDNNQTIETKQHENLQDLLTYLTEQAPAIVYASELRYIHNAIDRLYGTVPVRILSRDAHNPIMVEYDAFPGVEFRCTQKLFNETIEDITEICTRIHEYLQTRGEEFSDIRYTFTSTVKKDRLSFIEKHFTPQDLKSLRNDYRFQFKSLDFMKTTYRAFQGGLVGSNPKYTNIALEDKVRSIDKSSAYPFIMATMPLPRFTARHTKYKTGEEANEWYHSLRPQFSNQVFDYNLWGKGVKGFIGTFVLTNVKAKPGVPILPLDPEACKVKDPFVVAGKIVMAKKLTITTSSPIMEMLLQCYDFDAYCNNIYYTQSSRRLKLVEIAYMLTQYKEKAIMKEEGQSGTLAYGLSKIGINSQFGIKAQRPIRRVYDFSSKYYRDFDNGLMNDELEYEAWAKQSNRAESIDIFTDGIFIAAYGRLNLFKMTSYLASKGHIPVYVDTDSVKCIVEDNTSFSADIEAYNTSILNGLYGVHGTRITEYILKFGPSSELFTLGQWCLENEEKYDLFITLGPKQYMAVEGSKLKTTISGCSKELASTAITNYAIRNNISLVEAGKFLFKPGTTFDETCSGRTILFVDTGEIVPSTYTLGNESELKLSIRGEIF